jgi:hypothetical protein
MEKHIGFFAEMKEIWQLVKRPEVASLIVISLAAQWPSSYASTYLALYFSVRGAFSSPPFSLFPPLVLFNLPPTIPSFFPS